MCRPMLMNKVKPSQTILTYPQEHLKSHWYILPGTWYTNHNILMWNVDERESKISDKINFTTFYQQNDLR